jgi:hypothetical protein
MNVDIAFSDHRLSEACLEALGSVVKAIAAHSPDPTERFWTFLEYISINHPSVLKINLKPEAKARCDGLLAKASPPAVTLEASPRATRVIPDEKPQTREGGSQAVPRRPLRG